MEYIMLLIFFLIIGLVLDAFWQVKILPMFSFYKIKFKPIRYFVAFLPLIICLTIWISICHSWSQDYREINERRANRTEYRKDSGVDEKKANEAGYYKKNGKWYYKGKGSN
ncbi:hypothetical protein [Butyrivibrio sp. NC2007]|uniref:hypothetical protein n=1 Tax=Butyrivibrio sp. NC2007 TaxID=1280683 RepID=UPI0003B61A75|nr:hypothetical protein [Butyrivibrio sp. NC2007]